MTIRSNKLVLITKKLVNQRSSIYEQDRSDIIYMQNIAMKGAFYRINNQRCILYAAYY